jgi:hypothetical protein
MSDYILDGIELPDDMWWSDEFNAWRVGQNVRTSLTGALIVQEGALQAGRPITLESQQIGSAWIAPVTLDVLRALQAKEQVAGATPFVLTLPGHNTGSRDFDVIWRRTSGPAIEARPIRFAIPQLDGDYYAVTLRLMTV